MTGLRIACLTPWNEQSAIAQSAALVTGELERRGHEVTIFRTEQGEDLGLAPLPAKRDIHHLQYWSARDLRAVSDVRLVHIGDNLRFHGALMPRLEEFGAVGIFHDAFLADLAYCWADGQENLLRTMVGETYDATAWPAGEPFMGDLHEMMARRPMLEWFSRRMVAAVAHAEHYAARLRSSCPGPVAVIPLAFEYEDLPAPPPASKLVTVATVGHANPNKRIDQVVLAIASSPVLRSSCRVKVIGEASGAERNRLAEMARRLGIAPPVFTGRVSDEGLRVELRDVDVMSCLRNPVLEGASASLILAMRTQRPTLVSDHGCYAELPDDTLLKCCPDREAVDVMRHLEKFVKDRPRYAAMGVRAAELAVRRHSAGHYVDGLMPLLETVLERHPRENAGRILLSALASFGLGKDDPAAARALEVLGGLCRRPPGQLA